MTVLSVNFNVCSIFVRDWLIEIMLWADLWFETLGWTVFFSIRLVAIFDYVSVGRYTINADTKVLDQ